MNKKGKHILLSIVLLIVALFGIYLFTGDKEPSEKQTRKNIEDFKFLLVKVLVMDKEGTPNTLKTDDIFKDSKYLKSILYSSQQNLLLTEENDGYVLDLNNSVNNEILKNATDYTFAMNNNNGETIKDCKVENNKVIIPKSYYKGKTLEPVQMEMITRLSKKELRNLPVKVSINNMVTTTKTVSLMGESNVTNLSLFKGGKNSVKKSNIAVYVNSYDSESKIDNAFYELQSKTGNLTLKTPPIFLNKLIVKVNANIFTKIANMAVMDVNALVESHEGPPKIELDEAPDHSKIKAGQWYATENVNIAYDSDMEDSVRNSLYNAWLIKDYASSGGSDGNNPIEVQNWWSVIENYTASCTNNNMTSEFDFANSDCFGEDELDSIGTGHNVGYTDVPLKFYSLRQGGDSSKIDDYTTLADELETKDNKKRGHLSMSCIHVNYAVSTDSHAHSLWAYVVSFREAIAPTSTSSGSEGEMVVLLTTSENITTQTLFTVARYVWTLPTTDTGPEKGYIKIEKTYSPTVSNSGNAEFRAWKANSSGNCTASDFEADDNVVKKYSSNTFKNNCESVGENVYVIGYRDGGVCRTPGLEQGTWCVTEVSDGISTRSYYPTTFTKSFTSNGKEYYYTKVKISSAGTVGMQLSSACTCSHSPCKCVDVENEASCLSITKIDGDSSKNEPIPGIKFKLYEYSGPNSNVSENDIYNCLKNNSCNNTTEVGSVQTTSKNGKINFKGLNDAHQYFVREVGVDTVHYPESEKYYDGVFSVNKIHKVSMNKGMNSTACKNNIIKNYQQYYCLKVKKVDEANPDGDPLVGATFTLSGSGVEDISHSDNWDGNNDGYTTFFIKEKKDYTLIETKAPTGYATGASIPITANQLVELEEDKTENEAREKCKNKDGVDKNGNKISSSSVVATNSKRYLNWYKVNENGVAIGPSEGGAKFKVKNSAGKYIKVEANQSVISDGTKEKKCYVYDSLVDSIDSASELIASSESNMKGEVCISGVPSGTFKVIETQPTKYHTFGKKSEKDLSSSNKFKDKVSDDSVDDNTFVNLPTYFEFKKKVTGDDTSVTTEELKHIKFNIYDSSNNKLYFVKRSDGIYEYAGNNIDGPGTSGQTQDLYIDDARKIKVFHLPEGSYTIKEYSGANDNCDCSVDSDNCIGFYTPNGPTSDFAFTINKCNSTVGTCSGTSATEPQCQYGGASATTENQCSNNQISTTNKELNNVPTQLEFTKKDFYSYEDASDVVDFENDQERNDFDRIKFKVTDKNGQPLRLVKIGNHGTCKTDDSYAEYRYFPSYITDEQIKSLGYTDSDIIHDGIVYTCGGHIKITHLCRGQKYYIEEIEVPEGSVFTLPENGEGKQEFTISCCEDTTTHEPSDTVVINDKGTRVRFEKRDSKYHYAIPDENTTFEVYRCPKGQTCNLNNYITFDSNTNRYVVNDSATTAGIKKIKFASRKIISNDEEDQNDLEGLEGVEVYNAMSDADASQYTTKCTSAHQTSCYVTDLNPYHGILVLRYLQSGYNYILLETKAPKNYRLPSIEKAQTSFTVKTKLSEVEISDVANAPTSILIKKYDDNNNLLPGAQFKVYDTGTKCDLTKSPMAQKENVTEMNFKTIRDGIYESRPTLDTNVIQTCNDINGTCSSIPINVDTNVAYDGYSNAEGYEWTGLTDATTENGDRLEIKQGEALIQYLEYGHCYVIEEVKAPTGYSLPEKVEDRFTMIEIPENSRYAYDTYKTFINTPTPFTFYKYDEFGNPLDGAQFKLQKLDDDKKYRDLTVTKEDKNGEFYYKVDKQSTNKTIETKDGKATVYYLESGQYRILETSPAPGKQLGKNANVATFFVDDSGNVYGNSIIVNKGETSYIEIKGSSSAEYIISPKTGVKVVKYGLIIAVLVAVISGLMLLIKKMNKEEK